MAYCEFDFSFVFPANELAILNWCIVAQGDNFSPNQKVIYYNRTISLINVIFTQLNKISKVKHF